MRKRYVAVPLLALAAACADGTGSDDFDVVGNVKVAPVDGRGPDGAEAAAVPDDPAMVAREGGPELGAVALAVSVYDKPDRRSTKLGYLRVGATLVRAEKPAAFDGCQGGFYSVLPRGFVCVDDGATTDMDHPLIKANLHRPQMRPLPYAYGFVRAIAPRYYRLPTVAEQKQYEMSLDRHLRSFRRLEEEWQMIEVGSNDVRMLDNGVVLGPPPAEPPSLDKYEKFNGEPHGRVPWMFDGGRQIPNISSFKVPDYAVITDRVKRHTGLALIDAFAGEERDFALTTDLRLVPISKLKPGRGSTFHGVELTEGWELPMGFVKKPEAYSYEKKKGRYRRTKKRYAYGAPVQLTGEVRKDGKRRYVETDLGTWMLTRDLAIAPEVSTLPKHSKSGDKWIDVSIQRQVLVLYEGSKPVYATMVSTGKDGLADHRKSHATPTGTFRIRDKHITDTMDSQTVGEEFELADVPWVQYFHAGYALHAAYWHTEYGRPRSHGCINMSPIDAYRVFNWTGPSLPSGWHGVTAGEGEGTLVHVHP